MNKRITSKLRKETNMERHKDIFKQLDQYFAIEKKKYRDSYFIIDYLGGNGVCHFTLKETPQWLYGIWLEGKGYSIFGEHEELIDKFKPSRTYICHNDSVDEFIKEVQRIAEKPKLYFVDSLTDGDALVDYKETIVDGDTLYEGYQIKREFNKDTGYWDTISRDTTITQEAFVNRMYTEFYDDKKLEKEQEEQDRNYAFKFFKELLGMFEDVEAVGVTDKNKKGWVVNPRYNLRLIVNSKLTDKEVNELFLDVDKKVNDENFSGNLKTYKHGFSLYDCYDNLKDLKGCDYTFVKNTV